MRSYAFAMVLAAASASAALSRRECFSVHSQDLAEHSTCGHHGSLNYCFSQLSSSEQSAIETCFVNAGCSDDDAAAEAAHAAELCEEFSKVGELRRRSRSNLEQAADTAVAGAVILPRETDTAAAPAPTDADDSKKREGTACFTSSTVSSQICPLATEGGKVKTLSCFHTQVPASECLPNWLCTVNSEHKDICMRKVNSLDIGGIIISIVFGALVVIGIGYLAFASCQERRHHKRAAAKAEAVALARAATKKQRSQEARAPLMQQQQPDPTNIPNPFQDGPNH